ncbi:MAG TPA: FAD:protein FMN transferase [Terriglobales bacterium]|nr:FAD:protein FMN transferase [Terriglobales bacterium]
MSSPKRPMRVHKFAHEAMSTVFEIVVAGKSKTYAGQAARAAFDEVDRIERLFSRFDPSSEISRMNRLRPGERMRVGLETVECLAAAARVQAETSGAFDVNYRANLSATAHEEGQSPQRASPHWGRSPSGTVPGAARGAARRRSGPRPADIPANLLSLLGLHMVPGGFEAERYAGRAGRRARPLDLDLGAIGKGYALDRAAEVLAQWSVGNALLHAGTSTALGLGPGPAGRGAGWAVGVAAARRCRGAPRLVRLRGLALSGSGTEVKGEHIVDPRTGRPARAHPAAWAAHPSAALSDALSTAFFVLPAADVARYCRSHPEAWALVIIPGKKCRISNANAIAQPK